MTDPNETSTWQDLFDRAPAGVTVEDVRRTLEARRDA